MPPTPSSTKETTNYARICRLLVDVGTQDLRDTLDAIHAPSSLDVFLAGHISTLKSLRTRKIVNPTQWGKLFPAIPTSVLSAHFDITLLMVLLRNICGLASPRATGWDKLPAVTDISREADIARIKYYRNTVYAHAEHASIDDATFNNYWQEIKDAMARLGGVKYRAEVDRLETECMDPEIEDHYKGLLSQWKKDEESVKDQLKDIMIKLDALTASSLTNEKDLQLAVGGKSLEELLENAAMCTHHEKEPVGYYCEQCEVCICPECGETRHNGHLKMDIKEAAKEQKQKIEKVIEQLKTEITGHEMHIVKTTEMLKKSKEKINAARNNVLTTVEELIRVLKKHEIAMVTKLDVMEQAEERSYSTQLEHFEIFVKQLNSFVEKCEDILQRNVDVEILQKQQVVTEQCKRLLNADQMTIYKPSYVIYKIDEDYVQNVREAAAGRVVETYTDPLQSVAQGEGLTAAEVGREAKFTITTKDPEGKQCYNEDLITAKVQTSSGGELHTKIEHVERGEYSVTYIPDCAEPHDVMIAINEQPLTGSPWRVQVSLHQYRPVFWFGSPGQKEGQFYTLGGIAVNDRTGIVAVADHNNNRIQLFRSDGSCLRAFCQGSGVERLTNPISVAFDRSNDIIIIDSKRMVRFSERGHFISNIKNKHLDKPRDLTIARDGRMVVCDIGDNTVKVLSPDGTKLLHSFCAPDGPDKSVQPLSALYHQDMFFVCYGKAHCIKVFNEEGKFLFDIGSRGFGDGELFYPTGHTIDKLNNLIVCDSRNKRLQVFTLDGKFLNTMEGELTGFEVPWSLAASSTGQLFVTNAQKNSVHVFQ